MMPGFDLFNSETVTVVYYAAAVLAASFAVIFAMLWLVCRLLRFAYKRDKARIALALAFCMVPFAITGYCYATTWLELPFEVDWLPYMTHIWVALWKVICSALVIPFSFCIVAGPGVLIKAKPGWVVSLAFILLAVLAMTASYLPLHNDYGILYRALPGDGRFNL